jgi:hypothetical protein
MRKNGQQDVLSWLRVTVSWPNRTDYATASARGSRRIVYHSLRIGWRRREPFATHDLKYCVRFAMAAESVQMLFALLLGFAVAGLFSSGYRVVTSRLPSFNQLTTGPGTEAFAAIPLLVVSAPFLIMRNTILGRRQEGRRFEFVFLATLIAGLWSLMSGLVMVMTLQACGFLLA